MVKLTKYILLACIVLTQQACVKDLQDDINDGGWNHERTILDIQFENQMGTALIETADAAHHRIHDPTEEICRSKDHKSSHSVYHDLRVRGINPDQGMSAKISRDSHSESHGCHNAEAGNHDPVDPRILFAAEVLACEA